MQIAIRECRKRITIMWFLLGGLAFALMILYSFGGSLDNKVVQAWGWFLAATTPTMSIIAANIAVDATDPNSTGDMVDAFYYRLSMGVSVVYLVTILLTLVCWRMTGYQSPFEVMALSSIWIGPMQGIVASILSIFFKKAGKSTRGTAKRRPGEAVPKG
jgi:hypothetical protein